MGEEKTQNAAFITGAVNVYRISPKGWDGLNQSEKEFDSFLSRRGGAGMVLAMNVSAPPFDNLQVRKAVLRALFPWDYLRTIWSGQGFVSLGVPVQRPDSLLIRDETRNEIREAYFADRSDASDILASSGVPTPVRFGFTVADFGDIYLENGRSIEEDLRSVGFAPVVRVLKPFPVRRHGMEGQGVPAFYRRATTHIHHQ